MNDRQRRLKSIQSDLLQIYQDLFGAPYKSTGEVEQGTQFKAILQRFHEKHFFVREMQKDREKKEKKNAGKLTEELLKSQKIRQQISMCDQLLKEAKERIKNGLDKEDKDKYEKTLKRRTALLNQCFEMLDNLKTVEFGDNFEKKKNYKTLDQFKKRLVQQENDQINLEEQEALERFRRKDEDIEGILEQIRRVDDGVKNKLRTANEHINVTQEMIKNNMQVADRVDAKIKKGTDDLRQVLKHYRRPSKLCLDIILVLLLLALIGVIINMIKGSI